MVDVTVPRGSRSKQPTHVWLMSLTANRGMCTYCAVNPSTTLDHQEPIAGNGADIWWNFLPACKPCNDWKGKRSPTEWLIDQKLHRARPRDGFDTRKMPLRMFSGFEERITRVRREINDPDRRDWFTHHHAHQRHRNKDEMREHLDRCCAALARYPHLPWTTPSVDPLRQDTCTRRVCCGWKHPNARTMMGVIIEDAQYAEFHQAAFTAGMSTGDLLATLITRHLRDRQTPTDDTTHSHTSSGPTIPAQRS